MSDELFETVDDSAPKAKPSRASSPSISTPSVLDQLKERVSKKVEREPVYVEVPERPGITLQVSPNITQHQMRAWRKQAGEDTKHGMDATKFAALVVGHTTIGIFIDDEQVTDDAGVGVTFGSDEVLEMTQTTRPVPDAVLAFFGIDPHVEAAGLAILEAAGYSDSVEIVDPTQRS